MVQLIYRKGGSLSGDLAGVFAEALKAAEDLAGGPMTGESWRETLNSAQNWAANYRELEPDGDIYRQQPVSMLAIMLLSYLGDVPPAALDREIDRRLSVLGTEAQHERDVREFPSTIYADGFRISLRIIRQLLKVFGPNPSEGTS